jgi:hypothetical protein
MNRKLTLDVETLSVASFETGASVAGGRGTVKGQEAKIPCPSFPQSCQGTFHTCASFDRTC